MFKNVDKITNAFILDEWEKETRFTEVTLNEASDDYFA